MNVSMLTRIMLVVLTALFVSIVFITVTSSKLLGSRLGITPVPIIDHVNNIQIEKFSYKKQCDPQLSRPMHYL